MIELHIHMKNIQKMDLLIGLYVFCVICAEVFGSKTFPIMQIGSFALNASVAILVIPVIFSINDIITEVHGAQRARSVVRTGIVMVGLLLLFSLIAVSLPPSKRSMPFEAAYDTIFAKTARISLASLIALGIADFLDVFIFSKIRERLGAKKLWLRNNVSNFFAQFIDSTIFMFLAFYSLERTFSDNFTFLFGLILPYWLLKCSMSIIETPFVYLGVKWLKKKES